MRKSASSDYPATPSLPLDLWVRGDDLATRLPTALASWLGEPGLLTERIQAASGSPVTVRVVAERVAFLNGEQQAILEAPAASCFARRVELNAAGRMWAYAETLIPDHTLEAHPWLAELGDSSLGSTLAACTDLTRGSFEFAPLPSTHPLAAQALARAAVPADVLWARRSWFALGNRRLLVQEVFMPETTQC